MVRTGHNSDYVGQTYFAYRQEEVQFTNGDVVLAALAMLHGAGEATRMGNFAEAQSLTWNGVAVLI